MSGSSTEVNLVTSTGTQTIVEIHGLRMDKNHWLNGGLHHHHQLGLQVITFRHFFKKHTVGARDIEKIKHAVT